MLFTPPPPSVINCHTSDPSPPSSVTYFMDGPIEIDICGGYPNIWNSLILVNQQYLTDNYLILPYHNLSYVTLLKLTLSKIPCFAISSTIPLHLPCHTIP